MIYSEFVLFLLAVWVQLVNITIFGDEDGIPFRLHWIIGSVLSRPRVNHFILLELTFSSQQMQWLRTSISSIFLSVVRARMHSLLRNLLAPDKPATKTFENLTEVLMAGSL